VRFVGLECVENVKIHDIGLPAVAHAMFYFGGLMSQSPFSPSQDGPSEFQVILDQAGRGPANHPTDSEIRFLSPIFYVEPDERFRWLRENAPVYWDDQTGIWGVSSYAHIMEVSKDWEVFCSGKGSRPDSAVPSMINFDPPQHNFRRQIVSSGFTPRRVEEHEPFLRCKVHDLIDAVVERGECDFVRDIATPLPMYMIGALMGLPEADHAMLLEWSDIFATGGDEVREEVAVAGQKYAEYIMEIVEQRRGRPGEDLVSLIVNTDVDGEKLSDTDLIMETMLVLVGGDETTRHVISGGLEVLLRNPDQLAALRDDPAKLKSAIEEMLRWVTPIKNMNRTATRDVVLGGQEIREGDRLLLLYPSANRDAEVFRDPDRFMIDRNPNHHLAFGGYGRHHCLGAQLARLELRVLFEEVIARLDDLELVEPDAALPHRRGNFVLGLESMPIQFRPASRRAS
jgi:cytochrome P450 family 142 subfamily A polypeptide 1